MTSKPPQKHSFSCHLPSKMGSKMVIFMSNTIKNDLQTPPFGPHLGVFLIKNPIPILISGIWVFFVKNPGVPPGKRKFKWESTILNLVFRPKMKGGPGTPPQMGGYGGDFGQFCRFLTKNTKITIFSTSTVFFDQK